MEYRKIGNSDLEVSSIALGTWVFGGDCWGEVDDAESARVVAEAIEKGINIIDTAPVYGNGRSEKIIGKAIKGKRDRVVIATKCGLQQKGLSIQPNLSASFIREEIANSLRRLDLETIDLYQCHFPDLNTPLEETFTELKKLVIEGKIRYIGISNFDRALTGLIAEIAPIVSNQTQYSLLDRTIEEDLMPFCREKNISILSYGPLGGGILTGKYKDPPTLSRGDVRSFFYKYYREPLWSKVREFVKVLERIAEKRNVPTADVAINWVLRREEVASCIVGCRTTKQLEANVKAVGWCLSEEEIAEIDSNLAGLDN